jgi:hypothetical protein
MACSYNGVSVHGDSYLHEDNVNLNPHHYSTSWKVAGSIPDEVNEIFFSIYLILPVAQGPGVYSASNRNEYQKQKK